MFCDLQGDFYFYFFFSWVLILVFSFYCGHHNILPKIHKTPNANPKKKKKTLSLALWPLSKKNTLAERKNQFFFFIY